MTGRKEVKKERGVKREEERSKRQGKGTRESMKEYSKSPTLQSFKM